MVCLMRRPPFQMLCSMLLMSFWNAMLDAVYSFFRVFLRCSILKLDVTRQNCTSQATACSKIVVNLIYKAFKNRGHALNHHCIACSRHSATIPSKHPVPGIFDTAPPSGCNNTYFIFTRNWFTSEQKILKVVTFLVIHNIFRNLQVFSQSQKQVSYSASLVLSSPAELRSKNAMSCLKMLLKKLTLIRLICRTAWCDQQATCTLWRNKSIKIKDAPTQASNSIQRFMEQRNVRNRTVWGRHVDSRKDPVARVDCGDIAYQTNTAHSPFILVVLTVNRCENCVNTDAIKHHLPSTPTAFHWGRFTAHHQVATSFALSFAIRAVPLCRGMGQITNGTQNTLKVIFVSAKTKCQ